MDGEVDLEINVLVDQKMDRLGDRWVDRGRERSGGQMQRWMRREMGGCTRRRMG